MINKVFNLSKLSKISWYCFSQIAAIDENGILSLDNFDQITWEQWESINDHMVASGYDARGAEDTKEMFERLIARLGTFNKDILPDHFSILKKVLNLQDPSEIINQEKEVENKEQFENKKRLHKTRAVKQFGYTSNYQEAGYLLPNGKMLDFSGKRDGGTPGVRSLDHRCINSVFDDEEGSDSYDMMIQFIKEGNIRLNIGSVDIIIPPTKEQKGVLREYFSFMRVEEIRVNFGYKSKDFPSGTNSNSILLYIDKYFAKLS